MSLCIPLIIAPELTNQILNKAYDYVATNLGPTYMVMGISTLIFLLILALSTYGNLVIGNEHEQPEYGLFGWSSMLFCSGIGASLVLWGTTEWVYYYLEPPFNAEPESIEAIAWATSYGIFHWGITGWALYCLPAVAMAYAYHVRNYGTLRTSTACQSILGNKASGVGGRIIDLIYMVALLGVLAGGLGFTTPTISANVTEFFGIEESLTVTISVLFICLLIFATSVHFGIERGIQKLSKFCVYLALFLLVYILIFGPTSFIVKTSLDSLIFTTKHFIEMNIGPAPFGKSDFSKTWTVFYWAWFIGLGPFIGIFVARISRGRTLRTMIFGVLGFGTMGCALFFMIMGNNALYLELNGLMPIVEIMNNEGAAIMTSKSVLAMPMGKWILPILGLFGLIFMATTYDSGAYILASGATKKMQSGDNPEKWHRVFWAITIGLLPLGLLILSSEATDPIERLRPFQTIILLISPPLIIVYILMAMSLIKSIREDTKTKLEGTI